MNARLPGTTGIFRAVETACDVLFTAVVTTLTTDVGVLLPPDAPPVYKASSPVIFTMKSGSKPV